MFGEGVNDQELVSLQGGEPEPTLFTVAASFKEVPPSEYLRVLTERLGKPCDGACLASMANDDRKYFAQVTK